MKIVRGSLRGTRASIARIKNDSRVFVQLENSGLYASAEVEIGDIELLQPKREPVALLRAQVVSHSRRLALSLRENPANLPGISPFDFEDLVAELLADQGYAVQVTTRTADGGRDILALFPTPIGNILTIVECKKYGVHRKVGIELVERLLWVADRKDKASLAMLATTSTFTSGAQRCAQEHQYRLKLHDKVQLASWLTSYGRSSFVRGGELYIPDHMNKQ